MMKTSLYRLMIETSEAGLPLQREDGSLPPGHNGPHGDPERPSRNTGHWLMNWCFAHRETGDPRFLRAAQRATDYLMLPSNRPGGFTVHHRDSAGKDHCNGLMGPAFTLEALVTGGVHLDRPDMIALAREIVRMHPYETRLGMWQVREIDGSLPGIDWTLNHQIWFAATIAMTASASDGTGMAEVRHFLDTLTRTMALRDNDRIVHLARNLSPVRRAKAWLRSLGRPQAAISAKENKREIAYHFFSIHPLTILKQHVPDSDFWASDTFARAWRYPFGPEYSQASDDPAFIEPYIPAGFPLSFAERAFANQVFGPEDIGFQQMMIAKQFARTYDFETRLLSKASADPVTQAARSYEMTRLADIAFDIEPAQASAETAA